MNIHEDTINQIVEELDEMEEVQKNALFQQFTTEQPAIAAYLLSDSFSLLTESEQDYMFYLNLIIWKSINDNSADKIINAEQIESIEESNWTILDKVSAKNFRERLDVFFEGYQEEDLLAFVEDALIDEEDGLLTKEGREFIFVGLKSIIDCFFPVSNR